MPRRNADGGGPPKKTKSLPPALRPNLGSPGQFRPQPVKKPPPYRPRPQQKPGPVASPDRNVGADIKRANEFKKTPAYRRAIQRTYAEQPVERRRQILRSANRLDTSTWGALESIHEGRENANDLLRAAKQYDWKTSVKDIQAGKAKAPTPAQLKGLALAKRITVNQLRRGAVMDVAQGIAPLGDKRLQHVEPKGITDVVGESLQKAMDTAGKWAGQQALPNQPGVPKELRATYNDAIDTADKGLGAGLSATAVPMLNWLKNVKGPGSKLATGNLSPELAASANGTAPIVAAAGTLQGIAEGGPIHTTATTLSQLPGAISGVVTLPADVAVRTATGIRDGDPLRGVKYAGQIMANQYMQTYGPLLDGTEAGYRKYVKNVAKNGYLQQGFDALIVTGAIGKGIGGAASKGVARNTLARESFKAAYNESLARTDAMQLLANYLHKERTSTDREFQPLADIEQRIKDGDFIEKVDEEGNHIGGIPGFTEAHNEALARHAVDEHIKYGAQGTLYRASRAVVRPMIQRKLGEAGAREQRSTGNLFRDVPRARRDIKRERNRLDALWQDITGRSPEGVLQEPLHLLAPADAVVSRHQFRKVGPADIAKLAPTARARRGEVSNARYEATAGTHANIGRVRKQVGKLLVNQPARVKRAFVDIVEGNAFETLDAQKHFVDRRIAFIEHTRQHARPGREGFVPRQLQEILGQFGADELRRLERVRKDLNEMTPEEYRQALDVGQQAWKYIEPIATHYERLTGTIEARTPVGPREPKPHATASKLGQERVLRRYGPQMKWLMDLDEMGLTTEHFDARRDTQGRIIPTRGETVQRGNLRIGPGREELAAEIKARTGKDVDPKNLPQLTVTQEATGLPLPVVKSIARHAQKQHQRKLALNKEARTAEGRYEALKAASSLMRGADVRSLTAKQREILGEVLNIDRLHELEKARDAAARGDHPLLRETNAEISRKLGELRDAQRELERLTGKSVGAARRSGRSEGVMRGRIRDIRERRQTRRQREANKILDEVMRDLDRAEARATRAEELRKKAKGAEQAATAGKPPPKTMRGRRQQSATAVSDRAEWARKKREQAKKLTEQAAAMQEEADNIRGSALARAVESGIQDIVERELVRDVPRPDSAKAALASDYPFSLLTHDVQRRTLQELVEPPKSALRRRTIAEGRTARELTLTIDGVRTRVQQRISSLSQRRYMVETVRMPSGEKIESTTHPRLKDAINAADSWVHRHWARSQLARLDDVQLLDVYATQLENTGLPHRAAIKAEIDRRGLLSVSRAAEERVAKIQDSITANRQAAAQLHIEEIDKQLEEARAQLAEQQKALEPEPKAEPPQRAPVRPTGPHPDLAKAEALLAKQQKAMDKLYEFDQAPDAPANMDVRLPLKLGANLAEVVEDVALARAFDEAKTSARQLTMKVNPVQMRKLIARIAKRRDEVSINTRKRLEAQLKAWDDKLAELETRTQATRDKVDELKPPEQVREEGKLTAADVADVVRRDKEAEIGQTMARINDLEQKASDAAHRREELNLDYDRLIEARDIALADAQAPKPPKAKAPEPERTVEREAVIAPEREAIARARDYLESKGERKRIELKGVAAGAESARKAAVTKLEGTIAELRESIRESQATRANLLRDTRNEVNAARRDMATLIEDATKQARGAAHTARATAERALDEKGTMRSLFGRAQRSGRAAPARGAYKDLERIAKELDSWDPKNPHIAIGQVEQAFAKAGGWNAGSRLRTDPLQAALEPGATMAMRAQRIAAEIGLPSAVVEYAPGGKGAYRGMMAMLRDIEAPSRTKRQREIRNLQQRAEEYAQKAKYAASRAEKVQDPDLALTWGQKADGYTMQQIQAQKRMDKLMSEDSVFETRPKFDDEGNVVGYQLGMRPGYFPHLPTLRGVRTVRKAVDVRSSPRTHAWEGILQAQGRRITDPRLLLWAIERNIRDESTLTMLANTLLDSALDPKKLGIRENASAKEIMDGLIARGINPEKVRVVNPGLIYDRYVAKMLDEAQEDAGFRQLGIGQENERLKASIDAGIYRYEDYAGEKISDAFEKAGWLIVDADTWGELELAAKAQGSIAQIWDWTKAATSRMLLLGLNVPWLTTQIIANAGMAAVGPLLTRGKTGLTPRSMAHWYQLQKHLEKVDPKALDHLQAQLGWEHMNFDLDRKTLPELLTERDMFGSFAATHQALRTAIEWGPEWRRMMFHPFRAIGDAFKAMDRKTANAFRGSALAADVWRDVKKAKKFEGDLASVFDIQGEMLKKMQKALDSGDDVSIAAAIVQNRALVEKHAKETVKLLGDFSRMTEFERRWLSRNIMFYGFLRYSLRLAFYTLPTEHPLTLAMVLNLGNMETQEIKRLLGTDRLLPFMLGNLYYRDAHGVIKEIRLNQLNPLMNQFMPASIQTGTGILTPPVASALNQLAMGDLYMQKPWRIGSSTQELNVGDFGNVNLATRSAIYASELADLFPPLRWWNKALTHGRPQSANSYPAAGALAPFIGQQNTERNPKYVRPDVVASLKANQKDWETRTWFGFDFGPVFNNFLLQATPLMSKESFAKSLLERDKQKRDEWNNRGKKKPRASGSAPFAPSSTGNPYIPAGGGGNPFAP